MAFWLELHCDVCRTESAELSVMESAGNTAASLSKIRAVLVDTAKAEGWLFRKGEWTCPRCLRESAN